MLLPFPEEEDHRSHLLQGRNSRLTETERVSQMVQQLMPRPPDHQPRTLTYYLLLEVSILMNQATKYLFSLALEQVLLVVHGISSLITFCIILFMTMSKFNTDYLNLILIPMGYICLGLPLQYIDKIYTETVTQERHTTRHYILPNKRLKFLLYVFSLFLLNLGIVLFFVMYWLGVNDGEIYQYIIFIVLAAVCLISSPTGMHLIMFLSYLFMQIIFYSLLMIPIMFIDFIIIRRCRVFEYPCDISTDMKEQEERDNLRVYLTWLMMRTLELRDDGAEVVGGKKDIYTREKYEDKETTICNICLDAFEERNEILILGCSPQHFFHYKCMHDWLDHNPTCPLCRAPVAYLPSQQFEIDQL